MQMTSEQPQTTKKLAEYIVRFFDTVLLEELRKNDYLINEWNYFRTMLQKDPIDLDRIANYFSAMQGINSQQQPGPDHSKTQSVALPKHNFEANLPTLEHRASDYEKPPLVGRPPKGLSRQLSLPYENLRNSGSSSQRSNTILAPTHDTFGSA